LADRSVAARSSFFVRDLGERLSKFVPPFAFSLGSGWIRDHVSHAELGLPQFLELLRTEPPQTVQDVERGEILDTDSDRTFNILVDPWGDPRAGVHFAAHSSWTDPRAFGTSIRRA
jgi:hypothetical protein